MSLYPAALNTKHTGNAVGSNNKKITFESAMVNIGSLVTYLSRTAVKKTVYFIKRVSVMAAKSADPFGRKLKKSAAKRLLKIKKASSNRAKKLADRRVLFSERVSEAGFGRAVLLQLSDAVDSIRSSKKFVGTVINYTVPVVCVAFLAYTVAEKTSADYGVTVEYNGQEIGVVSEESVLDDAQEVIADRATYYDSNSDTYITAVLSLKPLGAKDEIIDEQTLADAIQEQIDISVPEETEAVAAEGVEDTGAAETESGAPAEKSAGSDELRLYEEAADGKEYVPEENGKERAFAVKIDGEFIGAVKDNEEITEFLEGIKSEYMTDDVVEVSFDKDIEYTYEQYVDPDELVDQQDIIDKLDSIVSEPVYYEVQQGDNPWNIAHNNGMTTEELNNCNITFDGEEIEDITEYCPIGAVVQLSEEVPYLQVLTTREVEYNEPIDYKTVKTEDPDMYKGDSVVEIDGVEGEKAVKAMITYKGDVPVYTEVISEEVISEPVAKHVRVGTRETTTPVSTGSGGSGKYFWPVDGGYISAYQGDGRGHKGIDIAAPYGTPIYAAESGTVIETGDGWNGGYGNCVRVQHDDGNITVYAHQSSIAVSYGDYVVKGQLLGYVGSTGDSTGNHLHFEVRSYGTYANPLDYVSQS